MIGIYKFTNKINGKTYIGQSKNIEQRYKNHLRACFTPKCNRYNKYLYKAIRKYGINNFSFDVLEECKPEFLNEREKYYINLYQSSNLSKGYNLTDGGDEPSNKFVKSIYQLDIETKQILNEFKSCFEAGRYLGKSASNIRHSCDGKYKYAYGYLWCYKDKYSKDIYSDYGIRNKLYMRKSTKPILQINKDTNEVINRFVSVKEAVLITKVKRSNIENCLTGLTKSAGGFVWKKSKEEEN